MSRGSRDIANIIRTVFVLLNVLGLVVGLIFLGASIFLLVDKGDLLSDVMFLVLARPACILVIAASACCIAATGLGLLASMSDSRILFIAFTIVSILIALAAIVGGVFAIIIVVGYTDWIRQTMRESIHQRYGVDAVNNSRNAYETRMWDVAQQKWYCCGVEDNSWGIYRGSAWYDRQPGTKEYDRPLVPPSCCVTDQYGQVVNQQKCQIWQNGPPKLASGQFNEAIFYSGCYTFGLTVLNRVARGIVAMGFLLALIEIATVFCSVVIIIQLGKKSKGMYQSSNQGTGQRPLRVN